MAFVVPQCFFVKQRAGSLLPAAWRHRGNTEATAAAFFPKYVLFATYRIDDPSDSLANRYYTKPWRGPRTYDVTSRPRVWVTSTVGQARGGKGAVPKLIHSAHYVVGGIPRGAGLVPKPCESFEDLQVPSSPPPPRPSPLPDTILAL